MWKKIKKILFHIFKCNNINEISVFPHKSGKVKCEKLVVLIKNPHL